MSKAPLSSWSIHNTFALKQAAKLIKKGEPIGLFNRGVCAIWGNGEDKRFVEKVRLIKGEKRGMRPLAATFDTKTLLKMLDITKVPASLHHIFTNAEELSSRIGSLCFIRIPITENAVSLLPKSIVSRLEDGTAVIQNWDAVGHKPAHNLFYQMQKIGIRYPAITSMNISGKPEIVNQEEGKQFAKSSGIPLFLHDPKDKGVVTGSYTILNVNTNGLQLIREGNISSKVFDTIFDGIKIDKSNAVPSKHPQINFGEVLTLGLSPSDARIAIISYAKGQKIEQIKRDFPWFKK